MPSTSDVNNEEYRLPTDVKPVHYDITIKTDLQKFTFEGLIKVDLDVERESSLIVLNNCGLNLGEAFISSDLSKFEKILSSSTANERTSFQLPITLLAGSKAQLKIKFSANLVMGLTGYYRGSFEKEGKTNYYAITQFQPTSARRAFPCWDEPLFKSTFAITMISRENTMNLSNMPVVSEGIVGSQTHLSSDLAEFLAANIDEKWIVTKFDTTPRMSSYIVAFANGKFDFMESSVEMPLSGRNIPLRIYSASDIEQAKFVMDVTKAVLPLYERIFDVEYPLPKLDTLVATDKQGAMENWGLITGQTNGYLIDPVNADIQSKKRVVSFQSHEIAHMWFGNITTMEWWTYLYLNEGFATLMGEVIVPDRVFPEWRVNSTFITGHMSLALNLDSKLSSHPVEVECPDANHIEEIFDALSYSKAGSVLRMLCNYVGQEKFLKGVSIYLKDHLFANSVTHDLWDGIGASTGLNIKELMENWITKVGFPVLIVTETHDTITVRQDRFLETGTVKPEDNETIWQVPLNIVYDKTGESFVNRDSLHARETQFKLDTSKAFKLNGGTNGFYRVLYTPERLARIAKESIEEHSIFSVDDRIGLVSDAMALAKAGLSELGSSLSLIDLWRNEKEYLVWQGIATGVAELTDVWWEYPEITERLNRFTKSLFVPLVERLGFEYPQGESIDTALLRTLAIEQALAAGDQGVVEELRGRFEKYQKNPDASMLPTDLQTAVYTAAVKYGGQEQYESMVEIFTKPKTPSEGLSAIRALSGTQDENLIMETLEITSSKTRDQDVLQFYAALSQNNKARRLLTKYVEDHYDAILDRFGAGSFTLNQLFSTSISFYSTEKDLTAVKSFYSDKDTSKYQRSYSQALDTISARIAYIKRSTKHLTEWLSERY